MNMDSPHDLSMVISNSNVNESTTQTQVFGLSTHTTCNGNKDQHYTATI